MKHAKTTALFVALLSWAAMAVVQAQESEIPNRAEPLAGITTGGQPSAEALAMIAEHGFAAVIDLRSAEEDRGFDEAATVEGLGMSYISLPVSGAGGISYENADALDRILSDIDGPVLLHCASSNRVGALLALRAKMHGADNEEALALGSDAGLTGLKPVVEGVLSTSPDQ
ncbi:MAG: sulfur transferase domain-containing protein [Gammaproteobacteria bacterium]|jgi:uncharacterized protein (TIGR01244 family)